MRRLALIMAALVILAFGAFGMTGCDKKNENPEGEDNKEKPVAIAFEVVKDLESLPEEVVYAIEAGKKSRGYTTYKYEGFSYVSVFMGEQSSEGCSVGVESVSQDQDFIKVQVNEESPAQDQESATVLTYPYAVVKIESDIQKFSVENANGQKYDEIKYDDLIKGEQGTYTGQIDDNSIEVKVGDEFNAFRLNEDMKANIDSFKEGSMVRIKYYENEYGQLMLIELELSK